MSDKSGAVSASTSTPASQPEGKEQILTATIRVIAEEGLRGMTYRAVAARAGVNNTLISYHFGSRYALLIAAMDWAVARTAKQSSLANAILQSAGLADEVMDTTLEDPELQIFQYEMLLESRRVPELHDAITELYERYIAQIATALTQLGHENPYPKARLVFATIDGLVLQHLTIASRDEVHESLTLLAEVVPLIPKQASS